MKKRARAKSNLALSLLTILALFSSILSQTYLPRAQATPPTYSCASGTFNESVSGNIHTVTFTAANNSTDANCTFTVPENVYAADYLVVAGGGGGNSGGGGAGGLVTSWEVRDQANTSTIATRGTPLTIYPGSEIQINVGIGGSAGSGGNYGTWNIQPSSMPLGSSGHNSRFGAVVATGGGRGGFGFGCSSGSFGCDQSGANGGSGGGGAYDFTSSNSSASSQTTIVGATSLGHGGGAASGSGGYRAGSGGGGAGSVGLDANVLHIGGAGGEGVRVNISGTSQIYSCGGGGGINENDPSASHENPNYYSLPIWTDGTQNIFSGQNKFDLNYSSAIYTEFHADEYGDLWKYSDGNLTDPNGELWIQDYELGIWVNQSTNEQRDLSSILTNYIYEIDSYQSLDGNTIWTYRSDTSVWTNNINSDKWSTDVSFPSAWAPVTIWTNETLNVNWNFGMSDPISGGGPGGCTDAGHGSDIGVFGPGGASTATTSTSGLNNFGHGGGGTDPESTVAGRGGNGVVIIRYVVPDPDCPNNGSNSHSARPLACPASLIITAGASGFRSIDVSDAPYSFSDSGVTASILASPVGMNTQTTSNTFGFRVPLNNDELTGGTYPVIYQLDSGGTQSESYILVTVIDPDQHTPRKIPVDPRAKYVSIANVVVGRISAVQVCVTPAANTNGYQHSAGIAVDARGSATTSSISGGGVRIVGSRADVSASLKTLTLSKSSSDARLLFGGKSRLFTLNVSNTAVGGNGSCSFGTPSQLEIYPVALKITTTAKVPVKAKGK